MPFKIVTNFKNISSYIYRSGLDTNQSRNIKGNQTVIAGLTELSTSDGANDATPGKCAIIMLLCFLKIVKVVV